MRVVFKDGRFDLKDAYEWPQVVEVKHSIEAGSWQTTVRVLIFYSKQFGTFTVDAGPDELELAPTAVKPRPDAG